MCKNEPYGVNPMGYIEDLDKIDAEKLYAHYKKILAESRIDIIFSGNFDEQDAMRTAEKFASELSAREYKVSAIVEENICKYSFWKLLT